MHKRPIIRFLFISAISGMPLYDLLRGACFQRATRRFLLSFLGECMRQILHLRLRISFVGCFADVIEYIFECLFLTQFQFERIPQKLFDILDLYKNPNRTRAKSINSVAF
eukprot:885232_1